MATDVDLRLFRAFVVVVERGGFTRAASVLGVTQPALSQAVRRLEAIIGADLIDRSPAPRAMGVRLTPAGSALHDEAVIALAAAERAVTQARQAAARSRIVVGFGTSTPRTVIGAVVAAGEDANTEIVLEHVPWGCERQRMTSGETDLLLAQLGPLTDDPEWTITRLDERARVVVVPEQHRLAGRLSVSLADLAEDPIIDAASDREYWLALPRPDGRDPVVVGPPARTAEEMLAQVAAGRGVAFTSLTVAENAGSTGVAYVPVSDLSPVIVALVHRSDERRPEVLGLVEAVRAAV